MEGEPRGGESDKSTKVKKRFAGALMKLKPLKPMTDSKGASRATCATLSEDYQSREAQRRFLLSPFMGAEKQRELTIGKLTVKVVEAANLPAADLGGTSDPYVKLTLTGRSRWNQEWDVDRRQVWQSKVVKKELCPLFHEETTFRVNRYDAVLRVEVFDSDVQSADDLLGSMEVRLEELAGRGLVKTWLALKVASGFSAPSAAVHLHVLYDASPLGEACSMVWFEQPRKVERAKFDINTLIANGVKLWGELEPYRASVAAGKRAFGWADPRLSRRWLAWLLFLAFFVDWFFEILHLCLAALLVRNYFRKRKLDKIKRQAAEIFKLMDTDQSNSLDRSEIGQAMLELAVKRNKPAPSELEIDKLFEAANVDGDAVLSLEEFTQMLLASPAIMGVDTIRRTREPIDDLDADDDELLDDECAAAAPSKKVVESPPALATPALTRKRLLFRRAFLSDSSVDSSTAVEGPPSTSEKDAVLGDEVASVPQKCRVKGVAKKMINIVGRKAGPAVSDGVAQLGDAAADVAKLRAVFEWEDPALSASIALGNVCLALVHYLLPLYVFAVPLVLWAFFATSEKKKALDLILSRGAKALLRYRRRRRRAGRETPPPPPLVNAVTRPIRKVGGAKSPIFRSHVSSKSFKAIVHGIFSRLDSDGSGKVDASELCSSVLKALPTATPRVRASLGGDEAAVQLRITELIAKFDSNGDGEIDFEEFTHVVSETGTVEVLIQDELNRQLKSDHGLRCMKLPSRKTAWHPSLFAHQTSLAAKPVQVKGAAKYNLSYTSRHGVQHVITPRCLLDVKAGDNNRQHVLISYAEFPGAADVKLLTLRVSEALRDPLIDLLRARIVQIPVEDDKLAAPLPRVVATPKLTFCDDGCLERPSREAKASRGPREGRLLFPIAHAR